MQHNLYGKLDISQVQNFLYDKLSIVIFAADDVLTILHQSINWTAAMEGIFSLNFCVKATRTVITPAAGPLSRTFTT